MSEATFTPKHDINQMGGSGKAMKRLCKMKARSNQLAEFIEDRDVSQYFLQQGTTCAEPDGYFRTY